MLKIYGASRNLIDKYSKLLYEEINKNDLNTESSILNKKMGNS